MLAFLKSQNKTIFSYPRRLQQLPLQAVARLWQDLAGVPFRLGTPGKRMQVSLETHWHLPFAWRHAPEYDCLLVFAIHLNVELLGATTRFGQAESDCFQMFERNALARLIQQPQCVWTHPAYCNKAATNPGAVLAARGPDHHHVHRHTCFSHTLMRPHEGEWPHGQEPFTLSLHWPFRAS